MFEEKYYNQIVNLQYKNDGLTFTGRKLVPENYFEEQIMLRNIFFYHIKILMPEVVNFLNIEIFPEFEKLYNPFVRWYKEKYNNEIKSIFGWNKFKEFIEEEQQNQAIIEEMNKWGEKYNLSYEWVYRANLANMVGWTKFPEHKNNKTWVYFNPFPDSYFEEKSNKQTEDFFDVLKNIDLNYQIQQKEIEEKLSLIDSLPEVKPSIELTEYREIEKDKSDIVKTFYNKEKQKLIEAGFRKPYHKKDLDLPPHRHFKWLVLSLVEGLKNNEILNKENNVVELSNISHNINKLKEKIGLK